jgi:uncharacterized membrane protein YfcA
MELGFVLLGAFVGTLVGMTGVGAGSLVTPALAFSGVPVPVAVGTDLAYAAISKSAGALAHRSQRSLDLRIALLLAAGSVPAAAISVFILAASGGEKRSAVIGAFLAVALIIAAFVLMIGRARVASFAARYEARVAPWRTPLTVAAGALLGVLVTLSSIGAGALGAAMLVALHPAMPASRIAGTDIAHAVPLTLTAGLGHLWLGTVDWALAGNLLCGSIPGIVAGSLLSGRVAEDLVRRLLGGVLLFAGVRLALAGI